VFPNYIKLKGTLSNIILLFDKAEGGFRLKAPVVLSVKEEEEKQKH
jgi:hypothetical protein